MTPKIAETPYEPTTSPDEWEALRAELFQTAEEREEYERTFREIVAVRSFLQAVDAERERAGLSKKELAARAGLSAVVVRRLLTAEESNPTFKTILHLCAALDLEIQLKPARRGGIGDGRAAALADPLL
jgi:ribosome-binding protein aMBF1 (putative translation factor)